MKTRLILTGLVLAILSACISYSAVKPGSLEYGSMTIHTSQAWNLAPRELSPALRPDSKLWTQDGILLDRIMIIPAVPEGEAIFNATNKQLALPVFKVDMLPNEIEELTESSISKLFGEGSVSVQTSGLRPHQYGDYSGILFDMNITVSDGPNYRSVAGAFIAAEKLYLVIYIGAEPYYFDKHHDEALVIIKGARI